MRNLFESIQEYNGDNVYDQVLIPWLDKNGPEIREFMADVAESTADIKQVSDVPNVMSWTLYALSRVLDLLTLPFQKDTHQEEQQRISLISLEEYLSFVHLLGLEVNQPTLFHPFYCEILRAEGGGPGISLVEMRYPALTLGHLLIKRGGAVITMSPSEYNIELVNKATIYWAYSRLNRDCEDLSRGWGSNSQWRTGFRFDFDCKEGFLYNAQGKNDLNKPSKSVLAEIHDDGLSLAEAKELTVYRQGITFSGTEQEFFPYDYRFFEPKKANVLHLL